MAKLPCGCTPDVSGYGWCSKCVHELRKELWRNMEERRRRYDRHFAPIESAELDRACNIIDEECCSCHISAPCSYCISKSEDEELT